MNVIRNPSSLWSLLLASVCSLCLILGAFSARAAEQVKINAPKVIGMERIYQLTGEEAFGTDIPDEDAEKLTTVGEVIRYVQEKGLTAKGE